MEPTEAGSERKGPGSMVQIDEGKIQTHLDEVVRNTMLTIAQVDSILFKGTRQISQYYFVGGSSISDNDCARLGLRIHAIAHYADLR